jgi:hypothetical protein
MLSNDIRIGMSVKVRVADGNEFEHFNVSEIVNKHSVKFKNESGYFNIYELIPCGENDLCKEFHQKKALEENEILPVGYR